VSLYQPSKKEERVVVLYPRMPCRQLAVARVPRRDNTVKDWSCRCPKRVSRPHPGSFKLTSCLF